MSDIIKDGGAAFPEIRIRQEGDPAYNNPTKVYYRGMSLRDWFAGMALQGILAAMAGCAPDDEPDSKTIAQTCFRHADAMLVKRQGLI